MKCAGLVLLCGSLFVAAICVLGEEIQNDAWKKKHITDYNDADLERLYEQWEVSFIYL